MANLASRTPRNSINLGELEWDVRKCSIQLFNSFTGFWLGVKAVVALHGNTNNWKCSINTILISIFFLYSSMSRWKPLYQLWLRCQRERVQQVNVDKQLLFKLNGGRQMEPFTVDSLLQWVTKYKLGYVTCGSAAFKVQKDRLWRPERSEGATRSWGTFNAVVPRVA